MIFHNFNEIQAEKHEKGPEQAGVTHSGPQIAEALVFF
jgi:hypothetical protein